MKTRDLQLKSKEELMGLLREKQTQLFKLRFEIGQKKVKNVKAIKNIRKDIAKILTILK